MKRLCQVVLLLSIAAVSVLSGGCGDDAVTLVPPSGPINIPIRNGTWAISEVATYTGADSCLARDSTIVDTLDVLCSIDVGETGSIFITTDCEIDTVGNQVVFDCIIRADLGICVQVIEIGGSGTVTDTTFDLSSKLVTRLIAAEGVTDSTCNAFYGNFVDACTTWIESVGTWVSSEGDSICPSSAMAPLSLEIFLERSGGVDLWRQ